ncbi:hypothetical protein [Roseicitreum antarcticum]|uniref:2-keto-4-pentenoate hydratase n=1 Tax=Roseicitreum antarcticum TaxID=564137 RepID=A0A1H2XQ01_9RHOB|nr:hypothetical protein [Roseicitreum antarcticum]SDW94738.1 2-keto-4-pentenoate hydratase [Roseicitreum antarcticum]
MTTSATETLAAALLDAHVNGTHITEATIPADRASVLAVQSTVMAGLGDVAGFKVGAQPDDLPIMAPIPARYCLETGSTRQVQGRLGIELEVAFEVIRDLPEGQFPEDPAAYFRPRVALEMVDTRLGGALADDPVMKFTDFQNTAGLIPGSGLDAWDGSDFGTVQALMTANGETAAEGALTVPGGSALANLRLLVGALGTHCGGLRKGHIVLTGSVCGLPYFGPGTVIEARIDGLGTVGCTLT